MSFDAPFQLSLLDPVGASHAPTSSQESTGRLATLRQDDDEAGADAAFKAVYELPTDAKVARAKAAIHAVFDAGHPVVAAYSAGKDSTVMLYLVLEVATERKAAGLPLTQILVTHANTGVDNPAYEQVTRAEIARIRRYAEDRKLPVRLDVATPALNDTWAVRIISGRALPTFVNSKDRDCSVSYKIVPQERQRKAALKELSVAGTPVVMVGTRFDESPSRRIRMLLRGECDSAVWAQEVRNAAGKKLRDELRLSPVAMFSQEDIWVVLAELQSGERVSYTDGKDIWEAYRDGGGTSCAVVSDDVLKANAKACGARFGCWSCAAVGRDKSLEAMIDGDAKYEFMRGLNRLQRFIVDTQYDMDRRQWVGRTITDDGYIAIAPDAYSPEMQRDLLRYALTLDKLEKRAARALGIAPRFEIVSLRQLIAIDAIWSMQGHQPRAFEAIHIWVDVFENGKSYFPPEIDPSRFSKTIPKAKWLYVGRDYDSDNGYSSAYSGARNVLADLVGATESGCHENVTLADGRVVMGMDFGKFFEVDEEGAEMFMVWEVGESDLLARRGGEDCCGDAFRHYQMLGTISTSKRHLGEIDYMLRRSYWKQRHGVYKMSREQLLAHAVNDSERAQGLRAPTGVVSLPEQLQERIEAEHARREATRWRPSLPPVAGGDAANAGPSVLAA